MWGTNHNVGYCRHDRIVSNLTWVPGLRSDSFYLSWSIDLQFWLSPTERTVYIMIHCTRKHDIFIWLWIMIVFVLCRVLWPFITFFFKYWFQDPLRPACWKTLPWTALSALTTVVIPCLFCSHIGHFSVSSDALALCFTEEATELWVLSLLPSCKLLGWYQSFTRPLSLPKWESIPVSTSSRYRSVNSSATRQVGPGWLEVVPGVYICQKPMNLKIEHAQPCKSPATYISWHHKLLVITTKIEGIRQKEVNGHNYLVPQDRKV